MNRRNYFVASSTVFAIVGAVHLIRVVQGWEAALGGYEVPMWASWAAIAVAGYLAFTGYGFRKSS